MKQPLHRRINLLPAELQPGLLSDRNLLALAAVALLAVPALGVLAQGGAWLAMRGLAAEISRRDGLGKELQAQLDQRKTAPEAVAAAGVERALAQRLYWAEAFKELTNVAPKTVWLTAFDTSADAEGKKVVIAGSGQSQAEIAEFYSRLERSYYFRDVQIKFTEAEGGRSPLVRFQFEGKVYEGGGGQHGPT